MTGDGYARYLVYFMGKPMKGAFGQPVQGKSFSVISGGHSNTCMQYWDGEMWTDEARDHPECTGYNRSPLGWYGLFSKGEF